ncbi:hypothetical protein [Roseateles sp. P5_E7]
MKRWFLGLLASCAWGFAAAAPGCPQPLRIGFPDIAMPPGLLSQGERFADPPGWQVMAVRDALARMGCTAELLRLPSRRLNSSLEQGLLDFGLVYSATPERLGTLAFPLDAQGLPDAAWAPAFGHVVLLARPGVQPPKGWNGGRLPAGWRVGVVEGSVQENIARSRGWVVEPVKMFDSATQMLHASRFDLLLVAREAVAPELRASLVEWSPVVARLPYFAPASRQQAQRHPDWTRQFWRELCRSVRRHAPDVRPAECGIVPQATLR